MGLRICFVTPFAWSQPHEVNVHVAGTAAALRSLGHEVTVLAPSSRARDLLAGRRALQRGVDAEVIAIGPSIPLSRRTHMGVPVAVRANLRLALGSGRFDVVHGFEPGLPSLSYLALTSTRALTAATFFSPERLGYPARRSRRDRLRIRIDALLATSEQTAQAAAERFDGDYRLVPPGVDATFFKPGTKRNMIVCELEAAGRPVTRALLNLLGELPEWELALLHTKPLGFRPTIPRSVRGRVHVRSARRPDQRSAALSDAVIFVPAPSGEERLQLEAAACGLAIAPSEPPDVVLLEVRRLVADEAARARIGAEGRAHAERQSFDRVAAELDAVYKRLVRKRRDRVVREAEDDPLTDRDWLAVDLHMHTDWSHDCSTTAADLVGHAERIGLGGIAVTDHNAFGGALEAVELARRRISS